jgi:hypothetical protein
MIHANNTSPYIQMCNTPILNIYDKGFGINRFGAALNRKRNEERRVDEMNMPIATECRSNALSSRAQNIHVISTTFVVYNPKLWGVRDKTVGDTDIMPIKIV